MKKIAIFLILVLALAATPAFAGEYQDNMSNNLVRGFKNVLGCWMEIPITVQEYHNGPGKAGIRHIGGVLDGSVQTLARAASGLWDFVAAFLPGHQEGMPVDPEVLF